MNEPEWRDVNPETADLPNKGRSAITFIACGLLLGFLTIVGLAKPVVGLAIGGFALFTGIGIFIRRQKFKYKTAAIITIAGFLMMLSYTKVPAMMVISRTLLVIGAVGLVFMGIGKALKISWDLGKRS